MSGTRTAGKAAPKTRRGKRTHPAGTPEAMAQTEAARAAKRRSDAAKRAAATRKRKREMTERWRPAAPEDYAAVEQALEKSKDFREQQRRLGSTGRVDRDEAVVSALAIGLTPRAVAKRVGLTVAQVERIRDESRQRYIDNLPRGESILWDTLRSLDAAIEQAATYCEPAEGEAQAEAKNGVRVAWFKLRSELIRDRLELMLAMGIVSTSPATYERERQARDYMLRFLDELRAAGVDSTLIEQVAERSMPVDVPTDTRRAAAELAQAA